MVYNIALSVIFRHLVYTFEIYFKLFIHSDKIVFLSQKGLKFKIRCTFINYQKCILSYNFFEVHNMKKFDIIQTYYIDLFSNDFNYFVVLETSYHCVYYYFI